MKEILSATCALFEKTWNVIPAFDNKDIIAYDINRNIAFYFYDDNYNKRLKEGGVYFLLWMGKLRYIGKARDLKNRIRKHISNHFIDKIVIFFKYDNLFFIKNLENFFIKIARADISYFMNGNGKWNEKFDFTVDKCMLNEINIPKNAWNYCIKHYTD